MIGISRRSFLKLIGLATTGTLGCSEPTRYRLPYINPPEDVIPGEASWFATTCRECPAGCGMLAKNRDTRIIKVEGNPDHPVNKGVLCPRGQASLTRLYDPDRIKRPMRKNPSGDFVPMTWSEAESVLEGELSRTGEKGSGERLVFMTELMTGPLRGLVEHWSSLSKAGEHVLFEPFIYESLKTANRAVFGRDVIPAYQVDQADFLISFNAGFLETWLSNVQYARQFGLFHEPKGEKKNFFVFVGPRQSMTAINADREIRVAPGDEYLIGIGILLSLLEGNGGKSSPELESFRAQLDKYSIREIATRTGVPEKDLKGIADRFRQSKRPLALAEGLTWFSPHGMESAMVANLLNTWHPGTKGILRWDRASAQGDLMPASELNGILEKMRSGQIDLLCFYNANPVFSLPAAWDVRGALKGVKSVISFSSFMDETTSLADFIFPTHTPLESWGEFSPEKTVTGIMQPVMGNLFDTRHIGDILISSGRKAFGSDQFPWKNFRELLLLSWNQQWKDSGADLPFESFWAGILQKGGSYGEPPKSTEEPGERTSGDFSFPPFSAGEGRGQRFHFTAYPTVQFYDGRMADSPWIQELPDPVTQVTWGGWAEIHPETAEALHVEKGDLLEIRSDYGAVNVPALPIHTVNQGTIAVPLGQGHSEYGRFAHGLPGNPIALYPPQTDQPGTPPLLVTLQKTGKSFPIANTDGSFYQHGRHIVETTSLEQYRRDLSSKKKPEITMPLPSGWDRKRDFYGAHVHPTYRWVMVVDLDRCIGCSACVEACYAENNVAFVGREQILKGREMSWIRVQRYFSPEDHRAQWLVMLCQHCDSAPCESVCPIYAPQHSIDGLNNQIYNRCFGTRFCSQNDPYKVRRFNWFTWTRPWPLDLQLNPDVTVRQKGVMEKCSFCIQRIVDAKIKAREKGQPVRDGDFTTACAQTCPTNALIFGNLKDPDSRVAKLIDNPRAYQVLHHLNTKPAVIYLKRIEQTKV